MKKNKKLLLMGSALINPDDIADLSDWFKGGTGISFDAAPANMNWRWNNAIAIPTLGTTEPVSTGGSSTLGSKNGLDIISINGSGLVGSSERLAGTNNNNLSWLIGADSFTIGMAFNGYGGLLQIKAVSATFPQFDFNSRPDLAGTWGLNFRHFDAAGNQIKVETNIDVSNNDQLAFFSYDHTIKTAYIFFQGNIYSATTGTFTNWNIAPASYRPTFASVITNNLTTPVFSYGLAGSIFEVFGYTRQLSLSEINSLGNYFSATWNIPWLSI